MNFNLLHTCNQKSVCIKLHRRPKPSLASYSDVKGILRGFVRLSLSIPPEYRIGRLHWRLSKVSCVSDFRKNYPALKKENLLWHVMLEKNMLQVWETDFYSKSIIQTPLKRQTVEP